MQEKKINSKLLSVVSLVVFSLNISGFAQSVKARKQAGTDSVVALLPASDAVAVLDVKRFFANALPQLFSGNRNMLAEVTNKIEEAKARTGIDLRQFDTVAIGLTATKIKEKEYDFETVIVARGAVSSGVLIESAKARSEGRFREEKLGDRSIYVFSMDKLSVPSDQKVDPNKMTAMVDKAFGGLSRELAMTAVDGNTLAIGSLSRVKEAIKGNSHVGSDLSGLLAKNLSSVMSFSARIPAGMSEFVPLDDDELGKNVDSIKYLYGSMDVAGDVTSLKATARTSQPAQAASLKETLEGLQMLGKAFLGNSNKPDNKVYARLVESSKFSVKGNEVSMDLSVAQPDIDFLLGLLAR